MLDPVIAALFFIVGMFDMSANYCGQPGGCLAYDDAQSRLGVSAGQVIFDDVNIDQEAYLRYELGQMRGPFQPYLGLSATMDGAVWAGVGSTWTHQFDRVYVQLALGAGLYVPNGGVDLGHTVEFRSEAEIGYQFDNGVRMGLMVDHRSNAGLGDINPGLETVQVRVTVPLGRKVAR
ncbi:acyloxyacyl hydrolase [Shimia biformata]|uniref:acyloxyacyl hydrolase n=1 Tax=Shimia biformata TaxID=1294299 RepID=UPI00195010CE|nr:acyloxyacyl hydrolase [Shimia biformata]